MKQLLTLTIIYREPQVLLGKKLRGFGVGKWNGFGGKVHEGEGIEEAAVREVEEEAGIKIAQGALQKRALLYFTFENNPTLLETHVFSASRFFGEPCASDEMLPQWFHKDELPYANMWADDPHWYPLFFAGKNFTGKFHFKDHHTLLTHKVKVTNDV